MVILAFVIMHEVMQCALNLLLTVGHLCDEEADLSAGVSNVFARLVEYQRFTTCIMFASFYKLHEVVFLYFHLIFNKYFVVSFSQKEIL